MKFDVVVGNPPYDKDTDNNRDSPVYHYFYDLAFELSDVSVLISPARFLFNAGHTPKAWNAKMLNDPNLKVVFFTQKGSTVFNNTDIKGGVTIIYRDKNKEFGAIESFTSHDELNSILKKVKSDKNFVSLNTIHYGNSSYKFTELVYEDYPELKEVVKKQERNSIGSNVFGTHSILFKDEQDETHTIGFWGLKNRKRAVKWTEKRYIREHPNLNGYKILVPGANGTGAIGEVLSTPLIGEPLIGHTQTFISFGNFNNRTEAESALKYIKTKFARTMLGVLKITQNNKTKHVWSKVPLQDFTNNSDIDWSKSIPEIDQQLYKKYNLSDEEINFIEEKVKEME